MTQLYFALVNESKGNIEKQRPHSSYSESVCFNMGQYQSKLKFSIKNFIRIVIIVGASYSLVLLYNLFDKDSIG